MFYFIHLVEQEGLGEDSFNCILGTGLAIAEAKFPCITAKGINFQLIILREEGRLQDHPAILESNHNSIGEIDLRGGTIHRHF